jgi:hypothetical protein
MKHTGMTNKKNTALSAGDKRAHGFQGFRFIGSLGGKSNQLKAI